MLAGLIFATDDAHDRPDMLAATLPFGGATLIEFQARLLIGAGAGQLIIVVTRLSPEMVGAVSRMKRRGIAVDVVRSAREAEAKLHPLARVLVVADGLVTTEPIIALLSGEGSDTLLVTTDADALPGLERVGGDAIWAGLARVEAQRIADVAALPRDYDFESTLLRVTAQAGADHLLLPSGDAREGHGVERDSARLRLRNDAVVAAFVSNRLSWVERYVISPIARRLLPPLIARSTPSLVVGGVSAGLLLAGLGVIGWGWPFFGLLAVLASFLGLSIGAVLAWMRDEQPAATVLRGTIAGGSALTIVMLGFVNSAAEGTGTGIALAGGLTVLAGLAERGASDRIRRRWWGSPVAYPLVLLPFYVWGYAQTGLALSATYAALSLAAVIEALREKP
ncbi:hypothetical protein [Sphingomonas sp. 28-62-11]|uniref:hypothetical protein n=1 Tax=Sphingomonas sp. 28-62-11 TaxID=1970432 RepID=UPI000BDD310A|nr:MAG: hypothetical protein B7Y49_00420 [Sphingomonas sp. 28-62-11]